jgi:hypothetical protein
MPAAAVTFGARHVNGSEAVTEGPLMSLALVVIGLSWMQMFLSLQRGLFVVVEEGLVVIGGPVLLVAVGGPVIEGLVVVEGPVAIVVRHVAIVEGPVVVVVVVVSRGLLLLLACMDSTPDTAVVLHPFPRTPKKQSVMIGPPIRLTLLLYVLGG